MSYPEEAGSVIEASPLARQLVKDYRLALLVLLAAVGLVLLIACVNVANLLLARASVRERELALRLAIGAGRARVIRQMLVESLELALAGGAAGVFVAYLAVAAFVRHQPPTLQEFQGVTVSGLVLAFAAFVSMGAGIAMGLLPAWRLSDLRIHEILKGSGGGVGSTLAKGRLREVLVMMEVALAVVLLSGAGLLLRSFGKLVSVPLGFDPQGVMMARADLPAAGYKSPQQWQAFTSTALQRLRAQPGVLQAAVAGTPPMRLTMSENRSSSIIFCSVARAGVGCRIDRARRRAERDAPRGPDGRPYHRGLAGLAAARAGRPAARHQRSRRHPVRAGRARHCCTSPRAARRAARARPLRRGDAADRDDPPGRCLRDDVEPQRRAPRVGGRLPDGSQHDVVRAGRVRAQQGFFTIERTCQACHGAGRVIERPCRTCRGTGRQHKEKTLAVTIPPGVEDGTRIRLAGEGEAGLRGAPTGDLYIFVSVKPRRLFRREGANIHMHVPIPMVTAALGGSIEVPTIAGARARSVGADTTRPSVAVAAA